MAIATAKTTLEFNASITLVLSEKEAAALSEMTKYGIDPFLKGYERCLGSHYIRPHKEGLKMLFETIDKSLPKELYKLEKYRKAICEADLEFSDT